MAQKILIVDDDPNIRRIVGKILSKDYDVTVVSDGWEAIASSSDDYDLLIMDMMMPSLSGPLAFDALDSSVDGSSIDGGDAPATLVLTALSEQDERVQNMLAHPNVIGYMQKPFTADSILNTVSNALASADAS